MYCDVKISKINEIKNALIETEKNRVRAIEDMYDWMVSVVPNAGSSGTLPKYLTEWVEKRKKLRAKLKELTENE